MGSRTPRHTRFVDWSLARFTTSASDDIIFVSSGTLRGEGHFQNVARTHRRGVEASLEYEIANRLSAFAAYTFQRATFGTIASQFHPDAEDAEIAVATGSRLPTVPAHTAKFGMAAGMTERLNVGVNLRAQSGQFLRGDEANLLAPVPGFAVLNAHARHRITNRVAAVVQVQNIFDAEFYTFGVLRDAESLLGDDFDDPRFYSPGAPRAWVGNRCAVLKIRHHDVTVVDRYRILVAPSGTVQF